MEIPCLEMEILHCENANVFTQKLQGRSKQTAQKMGILHSEIEILLLHVPWKVWLGNSTKFHVTVLKSKFHVKFHDSGIL